MKRLFVLLLALVLFVGVTAVLSSCDGASSEELRFRKRSDGVYAVDIGNIKRSTLEIPATYKGKAVVEIVDFDRGKGASGTMLESVIIPDSVTSISDYAFRGCSNLKSITLPEGLTRIGRSAFSGCTSLTSLTIPESVTFIGDSAFENCTGLANITISGSDARISDLAFSGCTNLSYREYGNAYYLGNEANPYAVL